MKILFIPYGTERAPATRYRVMQYLPRLKGEGVGYSVFSAISGFSTSLMIKSPDFARPVRFLYYIYVSLERLFRFLAILFICKRFDIIFLQRTTFPLRLETLLKAANNKIIFDIDDAIYMPDTEGSDIITGMKKYVKKSEVINILKAARAVIVENEYIKDFVSRYCRNIHKIPGPIDTKRFFVANKKDANPVVIGWIGSPATTFYLHELDDVFAEIKQKFDFVQFRFIGLGKYNNTRVEFERIGWSLETEVRNLQEFDIGIMPMPDNEWTRGKLGCKMLQYMAVGVPAVVSHTSTNEEIIKNGENGFFASAPDEWIKALSLLIEDGALRKRIGTAGRKTIERACSLSENSGKLMDVFTRISQEQK